MSKIMYVEPMGGMGNRFNCIISALVISREYGYQLYIIWNRDLGCAIKLSQLIESFPDAKIYDLYRMGYRRIGGILTLFSTMFCEKKKRRCNIFLNEEYMRFEYPNLSQLEKNKLFENERIYISTSCGWVDRASFEYVRDDIIPKRVYHDMVDDIYKDVDRSKLYGFHIRRTDHVVSIQNCPTILFTNKMDQLINQDSEVVFYVATDDYELEEKLKENYGNHIVARNSFSKRVSRNTKSGMMDAFVDVLCLSKCKKIYGSHSTFSTFAAYLGNTELEMMEINN